LLCLFATPSMVTKFATAQKLSTEVVFDGGATFRGWNYVGRPSRPEGER